MASNNILKGMIELSDVISLKSFNTVIEQTKVNDSDSDFMSTYQVSQYLSVDQESILDMIEDGRFAGTYAMIGENYIFSKEKLHKWIIANIKE